MVSACSSIKNTSEPSRKMFTGTILYDVQINSILKDSTLIKTKKSKYGNEMSLTFFKNGDILRKYNGASPEGFNEYYINVGEELILEHSPASDTIIEFNATQENIKKLNSLRDNDTAVSVLEFTCDEIAFTAEEIDKQTHAKKYLTVKYWYSDQVRVDYTNYTSINTDLWAYLLKQSNGGIFLKYEINYFDYSVVFTAKEIRKKDFFEDDAAVGVFITQ